MKSVNRQLAANSSEVIHAVGTYIWLKSATGSVQIKTDKGETAVLSAGDFVRTDREFTEFFVTDLSGNQNDLTFNTSQNGEAGKYASSISVSSANTLTTNNDVNCIAGGVITLLSANSNRKEAIIQSQSTNTVPIRLSDGTPTFNNGVYMEPGATVILETTSIIKAYSQLASVVRMSEINY